MRIGLLLVVVALPFLEIALLIAVGDAIGFWPTLALLVVSAAFGDVIYEQGFQVIGRAIASMHRGKAPLAPVIDGMFVVLGGVLLIMPGFISDALGLALLVPQIRHRFAVWSLRRLLRSGHARVFGFGFAETATDQGRASNDESAKRAAWPKPPPPVGDGPVIEGEFHRVEERTVDGSRRADTR